MLLLLSPSKTQEITGSHPNWTSPQFLDKTEVLVRSLRDLSIYEIAKLMKVSEKLAQTTCKRFADFSFAPEPENSCQALLAFRGDVFSEIDVDHYNDDNLAFAQQNLRILSGLYGLLRPLDLIQPYRLEIGGKFIPNGCRNLYEYWREEITSSIQEICRKQQHRELLNLASNEYFKVVNKNELDLAIIDVFFKQRKNGKLRTIAIHAKKARGALTNYIITNELQTSAELADFSYAGYSYKKSLSTPTQLTFVQEG